MIVTIMQPAYLPWLGYFDRIAKSDLFILLDHVQIDKNSKTKFVNRNKIRTQQSWTWLTVPLLTKGRSSDLPINKLEIENEQRWSQKHWRAIEGSYRRAKHYAEYAPFFEKVYAKEWPVIAPMTGEITRYLCEAFDINTKTLRSSEMKATSTKDELILDLCREAGATTYISGPFGRDYLDKEKFAAQGIKVLFHDYPHPVYQQAFEGFEPYMSVIDLLFNHGRESRRILETPFERLAEQ